MSADNARKRKAVTQEEKAHQRSLAKIKRLNMKLSQVKKMATHMEQVAKKGQPVPPKQIENWAKHINGILNVKADEQ